MPRATPSSCWARKGGKRQTESAASLWQPVALLAANQSRAHSADQVKDQAAAASGSMHWRALAKVKKIALDDTQTHTHIQRTACICRILCPWLQFECKSSLRRFSLSQTGLARAGALQQILQIFFGQRRLWISQINGWHFHCFPTAANTLCCLICHWKWEREKCFSFSSSSSAAAANFIIMQSKFHFGIPNLPSTSTLTLLSTSTLILNLTLLQSYQSFTLTA